MYDEGLPKAVGSNKRNDCFEAALRTLNVLLRDFFSNMAMISLSLSNLYYLSDADDLKA